MQNRSDRIVQGKSNENDTTLTLTEKIDENLDVVRFVF